jgi:hypothetical protein
MSEAWRRERIESWVADFCLSTQAESYSGLLREYAPEVLTAFLEAACAVRDVDPADLEAGDLKPALLERVARLEIPVSLRASVPALCADLLAGLEAEGRLGGGATLGRTVRALRGAYLEAAEGRTKPLVRPGARIGRNDPCPCGSGLKYKKCCLGRLGDPSG